jgi:hypothetical protein
MADLTAGPPEKPTGQPPVDPNDGIWPYLGVGCITTVSGFFGGGMIAVLIAKIVGAARSCTPDAESGAPCNWYNFAVAGALIGVVLFPAVALFLMRRSRMRLRNKG